MPSTLNTYYCACKRVRLSGCSNPSDRQHASCSCGQYYTGVCVQIVTDFKTLPPLGYLTCQEACFYVSSAFLCCFVQETKRSYGWLSVRSHVALIMLLRAADVLRQNSAGKDGNQKTAIFYAEAGLELLKGSEGKPLRHRYLSC